MTVSVTPEPGRGWDRGHLQGAEAGAGCRGRVPGAWAGCLTFDVKTPGIRRCPRRNERLHPSSGPSGRAFSFRRDDSRNPEISTPKVAAAPVLGGLPTRALPFRRGDGRIRRFPRRKQPGRRSPGASRPSLRCRRGDSRDPALTPKQPVLWSGCLGAAAPFRVTTAGIRRSTRRNQRLPRPPGSLRQRLPLFGVNTIGIRRFPRRNSPCTVRPPRRRGLTFGVTSTGIR